MAPLNNVQRSHRLAVRIIDERLARLKEDDTADVSAEAHNSPKALTAIFDDVLDLAASRGRFYFKRSEQQGPHTGATLLNSLHSLSGYIREVKVRTLLAMRAGGSANLQPAFLRTIGWSEESQRWENDDDEISLLEVYFGVQTTSPDETKETKRKHQRTDSVGSRSSKRLRGRRVSFAGSSLSPDAVEDDPGHDPSYEPSTPSTRDNHRVEANIRPTVPVLKLNLNRQSSDEAQATDQAALPGTFAFPSAHNILMRDEESRDNESSNEEETTAATASILSVGSSDGKLTAAKDPEITKNVSFPRSPATAIHDSVRVSDHTLISAFADLRKRTQSAIAMFIAVMVGEEAFLRFDADAAANIRPLILRVCNNAHAEATMSARFLLPSLVSCLMYDCVFQKGVAVGVARN